MVSASGKKFDGFSEQAHRFGFSTPGFPYLRVPKNTQSLFPVVAQGRNIAQTPYMNQEPRMGLHGTSLEDVLLVTS